MPIGARRTYENAAHPGNSVNVASVVVNAGDVLYVAVAFRDSDENAVVSGVTFEGAALSQIHREVNVGGSMIVELWRGIGLTPATGTVAVSLNESQNVQVHAVAVPGLDNTTPNDAVQASDGTGTNSRSLNVTTETGDLILGFLVNRNTTITMTPNGALTVLNTATTADADSTGMRQVAVERAGTGSLAVAFTMSGNAASAILAANLNQAVATKLTITTQPAGATSGSPFTTQPVVRLRDANNNNIYEAGTVVTAAIASGSGTLGGTLTATTDANGVATFTNLQITGSGAHTLVFTATGLTSATSSSFNVSAAASGAGLAYRRSALAA